MESWSGLSTSLEEDDFLEDKRQVTLVQPGETSVKAFGIDISLSEVKVLRASFGNSLQSCSIAENMDLAVLSGILKAK